MASPPPALHTLADRLDPDRMDLGRRRVRVRLEVGDDAWDAIVTGEGARLQPADGARPDAALRADGRTWKAIAEDLRGGMAAFERGRLGVRHDLHLGIGFLAAAAPPDRAGLRFATVRTRLGRVSTVEAGEGPVLLALHGLGATKQSFLPTVAALAPHLRVIAADLPGFGDSHKPLCARYDAAFFAREMTALLDALEIDRAHVVGNSMGGRVALELGLRVPDRIGKLVLLAPSMAWRRSRRWAPLLRLVRPELGAIQPAPRPIVEAIVERVVPGARDGWTEAGIDEFLRSYLTPRGRAAFYAAAREIYLEEPEGRNGFWPRLQTLRPESLFVWGRLDTLVPIGFARHVTAALPRARHLELPCGHVPQLEAPARTHRAMTAFLRG